MRHVRFGLPRRRVIFKHALRNALIPLITVMALARRTAEAILAGAPAQRAAATPAL
ncbi:MAG: hypothetical protein NVS1B9_15060 [Solirubrobacteraceae bacterium]